MTCCEDETTETKVKHRYEPELKLDFLQTGDVAVAKLALYTSGRDRLESLGDSKRHPTDDVDMDLGEDLALARALIKMAFLLLKQYDEGALGY